jgi:hypothetical protein
MNGNKIHRPRATYSHLGTACRRRLFRHIVCLNPVESPRNPEDRAASIEPQIGPFRQS